MSTHHQQSCSSSSPSRKSCTCSSFGIESHRPLQDHLFDLIDDKGCEELILVRDDVGASSPSVITSPSWRFRPGQRAQRKRPLPSSRRDQATVPPHTNDERRSNHVETKYVKDRRTQSTATINRVTRDRQRHSTSLPPPPKSVTASDTSPSSVIYYPIIPPQPMLLGGSRRATTRVPRTSFDQWQGIGGPRLSPTSISRSDGPPSLPKRMPSIRSILS